MLAQVFNPTEIGRTVPPEGQQAFQHGGALALHSSACGAAHHGRKLRRCTTHRQRRSLAVGGVLPSAQGRRGRPARAQAR